MDKILEPGDEVPNFSRKDCLSNTIQKSDLEGNPWGLYFFQNSQRLEGMKINQALMEHFSELADLEICPLGICPEDEKSLQALIKIFSLPSPLICDKNFELCHLFNVLKEGKVEPSIFLIDSVGTIPWIEKPIDLAKFPTQLLNGVEKYCG